VDVLETEVLMNRIAIPVFKSRISPVFDACNRVLLVDLDQNREIKRAEIIFEDLSVLERLRMLNRLRVTNVICAGISQSLHDKLTAANISPITGIVGEVGEVLSAFMDEGLNDPRFYMPGYNPSS
jgi:predicted Fe-Mo cluster-binding NifX family protein